MTIEIQSVRSTEVYAYMHVVKYKPWKRLKVCEISLILPNVIDAGKDTLYFVDKYVDRGASTLLPFNDSFS